MWKSDLFCAAFSRKARNSRDRLCLVSADFSFWQLFPHWLNFSDVGMWNMGMNIYFLACVFSRLFPVVPDRTQDRVSAISAQTFKSVNSQQNRNEWHLRAFFILKESTVQRGSPLDHKPEAWLMYKSWKTRLSQRRSAVISSQVLLRLCLVCPHISVSLPSSGLSSGSREQQPNAHWRTASLWRIVCDLCTSDQSQSLIVCVPVVSGLQKSPLCCVICKW